MSIIEQIEKAVKMATKNGILRPNAVDSLTGKNSGTNLGDDYPKIIFEKNLNDFKFHNYISCFFSNFHRKYAEPPHNIIAPNKNIIIADLSI